MKRYVNNAIKFSIVFLTGMMTFGFLQSAYNYSTNRQGNIGGEVLILPLMVCLVVLGWSSGRTYWKEKEARTLVRNSFKQGYSIGVLKTINEKIQQPER